MPAPALTELSFLRCGRPERPYDAFGDLSMRGRTYTVFDTAIGRCAIAWSEAGIVGIQLPEAREIDTCRRLFQLYPDARETRPTPNSEAAIEGIVALLRGEAADCSHVALD